MRTATRLPVPFRIALSNVLLAGLLVSAQSKLHEQSGNDNPTRSLQYDAAAAAPSYSGAQASTAYVQPVAVAYHYHAPERISYAKTKRTHYAAAHYVKGKNTVHRESHDYDCGYAPPVYAPPVVYSTAAYAPKKKNDYTKQKNKDYTTTETHSHVVTETYASPDAAAKAGYRRVLFEVRRALTGNGCPKAGVVHDYTLLWMFVILIIVILLVWWCCRCFDSWCMWHPRRKPGEAPMDEAARRRKEQLAQLEWEREHGIISGRESELRRDLRMPGCFCC